MVALFGLLADDWIASLGLLVLFAGWFYLSREPGPPIIAATFSIQWVQVMAGLVYFAITTRQVPEMHHDGYRPMLIIRIGVCTALFGGFYVAAGFRHLKYFRRHTQRLLPWSARRIAVIYLLTVAASGILMELAWSAYGLTQVLLVGNRIRYVFLYLLVTRVIAMRTPWPWVAGILVTELTLGFGGFFADFREPLVIVAMAVIGTMNRRRTKTWVIAICLAALGLVSGIVWTAIKPIIRQDYRATATRSARITAAVAVTGETFTRGGSEWKNQTDAMISRIWAIYFPAMALQRVPSVVPYQNGAILWGAIRNVLMPRFFFAADKKQLPSTSEEVREYAGVWVAGRETNTSYAFGFAGESYVDFGTPLMFFPIFGWGLALGFAYRWLGTHIFYGELRDGATIVVFWATMGLYEASWVMMIGPGLTIFAILGGGALLIDKILRMTSKEQLPSQRRRTVSSMPGQPYRLNS